MVLLQTVPTSQVFPTNSQLKLESGRVIRYVAAEGANPRKETRVFYDELPVAMSTDRRRSNGCQEYDDWEGVNALCQVIDTITEIEMETELFDNKSVLEIGFATGLPATLAMECGASEVTVHCPNKLNMDEYIRPTLKGNLIASNRMKMSCGEIIDFSPRGKKYDVILAPEILNSPSENYPAIHNMIDEALTDDGICFLTSRLTYFNGSGSLPEFLNYVKTQKKLEHLVRWTSQPCDIVPRQVIQLTRTIF